MLENIPLAASVICAVAAVSTSLRAVGISREYSRATVRKTLEKSCRIGSGAGDSPKGQRSSLLLHLLVTVIWYVLSLLFSVPFFMGKIESAGSTAIFLWILSCLLLLSLLFLVWKKTFP